MQAPPKMCVVCRQRGRKYTIVHTHRPAVYSDYDFVVSEAEEFNDVACAFCISNINDIIHVNSDIQRVVSARRAGLFASRCSCGPCMSNITNEKTLKKNKDSADCVSVWTCTQCTFKRPVVYSLYQEIVRGKPAQIPLCMPCMIERLGTSDESKNSITRVYQHLLHKDEGHAVQSNYH